jgi:hypothetical protein
MHTHSTILETAMNKETPYTYCLELFGDLLLDTSHFREVQNSEVKRGPSIHADAHGAMVVMQRVQELAKKGTVHASCGKRAQKIENVIREVCESDGMGAGENHSHTYTHTRLHTYCTHAYIGIHTHIHICMHTCIHTYKRIYTRVCPGTVVVHISVHNTDSAHKQPHGSCRHGRVCGCSWTRGCRR